nr:hypothetical protein GCM10020093_085980 [Planobispora longispora]
MDESVAMALLTVLERLTPAERTAFILHDVFAVPFPEIAGVVGRSPDSVRQLASRARKRVRAEAPHRPIDLAEHRRVVEAFVGAVTGGDFENLLSVLDPDVVWRSDGGGKVIAARVPVTGAERVAAWSGASRAGSTRTARGSRSGRSTARPVWSSPTPRGGGRACSRSPSPAAGSWRSS